MHAHAPPTRDETPPPPPPPRGGTPPRRPAPPTSAPAAALPTAPRMTGPVIGQVNASVGAPAGATTPTSWFELASSGAIATPASTHSGSIAHTDGAAASGREVKGRRKASPRYVRPSGSDPTRAP